MHSVAEEGGKRSYDVRYLSLHLSHSLLTLGVRGCGTSGPRVLYCETDPIHVVVAFKVYDMDRDNFISNGELFLVLKMMVGNNLKVQSLFMANVT